MSRLTGPCGLAARAFHAVLPWPGWPPRRRRRPMPRWSGSTRAGVSASASSSTVTAPSARSIRPPASRSASIRAGAQAGQRTRGAGRLVPVLPTNRVQFLQQGKVDLLVASMLLTPERAALLDYVPTPYYRNGGTAIFLKRSGIRRWKTCAARRSACRRAAAMPSRWRRSTGGQGFQGHVRIAAGIARRRVLRGGGA